jgi:long-chain acyl-CoA synthetase
MIHQPIYKVRTIKSLKDMLEQSEKLFSEKAAFSVKQSDQTYKPVNYKNFKSDIDSLGTAFIKKLGLKDKFIAVIGENRYEWCVTYLSTVCGTGVIIPLDKELPVQELENLLLSSNASAIVYSGKLCREINQIRANLPEMKFYINMNLEQNNEKELSFTALLNEGRKMLESGNKDFIDAEIDPEVMSVLLFTSGTTGNPKGVMLSHKNICFDIMAVCQSLYIDSNDSVLSILPLHHTYECTAGFLVMIYNGCTISFNEGLKHISKNLKETSPTILMLVPLILENMYKKIWERASKERGLKTKLKIGMFISNLLYKILKIDNRNEVFKEIHENMGGKLRLIIAGAAAIDPKVSKGFRTFGFVTSQGYGLTECSPIVSVNREKQFRDDSIGQPLPGIEMKIVNPGSDEVGEIYVKGDNVMLGYYKNEEETKKVLSDDVWFNTGDLGKVCKNDFYLITGRKKNVIVTKNGKNVFPEEVEAYLNKSPYILESMVYGKDSENGLETIVCAQIVPDFDAIKEKLKVESTSKDAIDKLLNFEVKSANRNMPLYKHVREFTIRENEFEKTTTRKIKRYLEKIGL